MRTSLHLPAEYDGLVYLFDAAFNPPAMRSHSHVELEVNLVVEGTLIYRVGGRQHKLAPGCMIWHEPRREHQVLDRSHQCRMLVAAFKPGMVTRIGVDSPHYSELHREGCIVRTVRPEDGVFLASVCRHILDGQVDHARLNAGLGYGQNSKVRYRHASPSLLNSGLHFLLAACWKAFDNGETFHGASSLHPAVARAIEQLQEVSEPVPLSELARRCGSSPAHLSRLFHQQTGIRLNEYRNTVRIERFLALYGEGSGKSATEACLEAGFGSYAQFSKVFHKAYHKSPRAYAKGLRFGEKSAKR